MEKHLKYLLAFVLFAACNSEDQSLPEIKTTELEKYFRNQYKLIDDSSRIDSFSVLKLDTITEQSKYATLSFEAMGEWQKQNQLLELENTLLQKRISLMQLTKGQPESEQSKKEAKESLDAISMIENKIKEAQKKMNFYDSLSRHADGKGPIGFEAICIYRIQKKDWTEQIDTAYIIMDKSKNIVSREEFYKN